MICSIRKKSEHNIDLLKKNVTFMKLYDEDEYSFCDSIID